MARGNKSSDLETTTMEETTTTIEPLVLLPSFSEDLVNTLRVKSNITEVYFIKDGTYSFRATTASDGKLYTRCFEALENLKGGISGAKKILIGVPETLVTQTVSRDTILK